MKLPPGVYKVVIFDDTIRFADIMDEKCPQHIDMPPKGATVRGAGIIAVGEDKWLLTQPYSHTLLAYPMTKDHVVEIAEFLELPCGSNFSGGLIT